MHGWDFQSSKFTKQWREVPEWYIKRAVWVHNTHTGVEGCHTNIAPKLQEAWDNNSRYWSIEFNFECICWVKVEDKPNIIFTKGAPYWRAIRPARDFLGCNILIAETLAGKYWEEAESSLTPHMPCSLRRRQPEWTRRYCCSPYKSPRRRTYYATSWVYSSHIRHRNGHLNHYHCRSTANPNQLSTSRSETIWKPRTLWTKWGRWRTTRTSQKRPIRTIWWRRPTWRWRTPWRWRQCTWTTCRAPPIRQTSRRSTTTIQWRTFQSWGISYSMELVCLH